MIKKFLLSGLENLPDPSAMFNELLKEALKSWSETILFFSEDLDIVFKVKCRFLDFL